LGELKAAYKNFDFFVRQHDHGLSNSLVDGFSRADTDIILVIDADGQHPPEKIPELYQAIKEGNDIAIASRYMGIAGSGVKDWAYHRRVLSWGATALARFFFPAISDSGSGFFAFRKEVIIDAPLKPQGFRMLFEILGKGHWKTVKEIPYTFQVREKGVSKLTHKTILSYLRQLWDLLKFSFAHKESTGYKELVRIFTFMGVGLTGILIFTTTLYLVTEKLGVFYVWSSWIGFEASILSNFILNDRFTFRDIPVKKFTRKQRLVTYHLVSIAGNAISFSVMFGLTTLFGIWYIVSGLIGVMAGFVWNFVTNRTFTWSSEK
jgi:dolichol-phosphate mannosyltransferase